jgi:hypothetical protein
MSEIADELERLAKEMEEEGKRASARPREFEEAHNQAYFVGKAAAHLHAAKHLRERAAEIRARPIGPAPVGLPKPKRAMVRQWWSYEGLPPKRVAQTSTLAGKTVQRLAIFELCSDEADMLTNHRWLYLGDGPEPQNA